MSADKGTACDGQSRRAAAGALRGAPAHAHAAAHRAQHGAAGRRRAVPVQRGAGRAGRGQPAVRDPLRGGARLRRLPGAAQASAGGRARRAGRRDTRPRTTSTSRPSRPRSRTCGIWPRCSPTPRPVERAGRLLAASRPLPVLGLRAAASQAYGFAYFAAKVHPDVRLLHEGGTMLARPHRRGRTGRGDRPALLRAAPASARGRRTPGVRKEAGLTVVTVADSAFAPVAKVPTCCCPPPSAPGSPSTPPARRCCWAGCCWRPCATTCRRRRPGWRSSTRGRRSGGCSWSRRPLPAGPLPVPVLESQARLTFAGYRARDGRTPGITGGGEDVARGGQGLGSGGRRGAGRGGAVVVAGSGRGGGRRTAAGTDRAADRGAGRGGAVHRRRRRGGVGAARPVLDRRAQPCAPGSTTCSRTVP